MAGKVKTWVWVVVAIVVIGVLGVIAMAGVGLYFFSQHIDDENGLSRGRRAAISSRSPSGSPVRSRSSSSTSAAITSASNTDRQPAPNAKSPDELHVMAFDPDDGRIVRVNIPFWLLRMKMRGTTIDFNGNRMDLEDLRLTVEDLERFGPTLIVDHRSTSGERVLVWSQ